MANRCLFRASVTLCLGFVTASTVIADEGSHPVLNRPFATAFAASISRLHSACDVIFDSVDRRDLSDSLDGRLERYNEFSGIDRTKPLGLMYTWGNYGDSQIVFLPVTEIDDLMETATFGIVDYHQINSKHYEIDRPGKPFQVVVRKDYAFFGESVSAIQAIQPTPELLTRVLRDRYDLAVHFDLLQVPKSTKADFVNELIKGIVPSLQQHDDESDESAGLRKSMGRLMLDLVERAILDTSAVTLGIRLDPETRQIHCEVSMTAVPKSRMAISLSQLVSYGSEFSPLMQSDAPAGMILNLKLASVVEQILGLANERTATQSRLEAGFQLMGTGPRDFSLVVGLKGSDAKRLNQAIPGLLLKMEKSGQFEHFDESIDSHHGVVIHSLIPREIPAAITDWAGSDVEMIVGQGKESVWMGIGAPERLQDYVEDAINRVDEPSSSRFAAPLLLARIQARKLSQFVVSQWLIPNLSTEIVQEVLSQGDDSLRVTVEPIADGIKLRIDFDEGFTRLIGRDWIQQIEASDRH